jgi:hypothetical protein
MPLVLPVRLYEQVVQRFVALNLRLRTARTNHIVGRMAENMSG